MNDERSWAATWGVVKYVGQDHVRIVNFTSELGGGSQRYFFSVRFSRINNKYSTVLDLNL